MNSTKNTIKKSGQKSVRTIDCTPTWHGILPLLIEFIQNPKSYENGEHQLRIMAKTADKFNLIAKQIQTSISDTEATLKECQAKNRGEYATRFFEGKIEGLNELLTALELMAKKQ